MTLSRKHPPSCIKAFRIGNFKAFSDLQTIPLRPLTLIYGANSSGKSSILHGLLLAHHAIKNKGELDIHRTTAGGDSVDLGGFGQYVHKRDRTSRVQWAIDVDPGALELPDRDLAELLETVNTLTVGIGIGIQAGDGRKVGTMAFYLEADGREILVMSSRPNGRLQLDRLDTEHPIISRLIEAIVQTKTDSLEITETKKERIEEIINELVPKITATTDRLFPSKLSVEDELEPKKPLPLENDRDLPEVVRLAFPSRLNALIGAIVENIENNLGQMHYLGPFRTYPPRHFAFSRQTDDNWDSGGGYTWDMLLDRTDVREKVNTWLGDETRMNTPYEINVRTLLPSSLLATELDPLILKFLEKFTGDLIHHFYADGSAPEGYDRLEQLLWSNSDTDIQELINQFVDTDELSENWIETIRQEHNNVQDLILIDKRNQTEVTHRDVGIGVSQIIPILVSCYGLSDSLIAIEQPEIHLHPKLQAELGSVFAESIKPPNKNTFILETHSEHLMLRLQRLIREGQLTPEDISVIYVDCAKEGSICLTLRLDEEGDFIDEWPNGFFEEDFNEVFG